MGAPDGWNDDPPAARRVGRAAGVVGLRGGRARLACMVLSREQVLGQVWGYTVDVQTSGVDGFVGYLWRNIEGGGHEGMIHTVRGVGFRAEPN